MVKPLGGGWTGRNAEPEWEPTRNPTLSGPRAASSPAPPQPGPPSRLLWDPHEKPRRRDGLSKALLCGPREKPITRHRASLHPVDNVDTACQPDPHLRPRHVVFHDLQIADQPSVCSFPSTATGSHRSADGCTQQLLTPPRSSAAHHSGRQPRIPWLTGDASFSAGAFLVLHIS